MGNTNIFVKHNQWNLSGWSGKTNMEEQSLHKEVLEKGKYPVADKSQGTDL